VGTLRKRKKKKRARQSPCKMLIERWQGVQTKKKEKGAAHLEGKGTSGNSCQPRTISKVRLLREKRQCLQTEKGAKGGGEYKVLASLKQKKRGGAGVAAGLDTRGSDGKEEITRAVMTPSSTGKRKGKNIPLHFHYWEKRKACHPAVHRTPRGGSARAKSQKTPPL